MPTSNAVASTRQRTAVLPRLFFLSLLATTALVIYLLWNSYCDARRATELTAQNIVTAVAAEIAAGIEPLRANLKLVAEASPALDAPDGPGSGDRTAARTHLQQHLEIGQMAVYSIAGQVRVMGRDWNGPMNVAGEQWFSHLLGPGPEDDAVVLIGGDTGAPSALLVAHRIVDGEGRLKGVAAGYRTIPSLSESFSSFDIGSRGTLVLRRTFDNRQLLRRPNADIPVAPITPVAKRVAAGEAQGIAHYRGPDAVSRVYAFQQVKGLPLYVNAGLADDDYLADWRWRALWLTVAAALLLGTLSRAMSRQVASESRLADSELLFRSLSDSTPAMVWMSARNGRSMFFNPAWLQFTGRSLDSERALHWSDDLHPDDRNATIARYRQAIASEQPFTIEYRKRRQDGEWRWVLDTGQPRRSKDGVLQGFVGSLIDITARKQAETAMADRLHLQQQLATLAETVPGAIYTFKRSADGQASFPYASPVILSIFGIPAESLKQDASPMWALLHPDDRERVMANMRESARTRERWSDQFRVRHPERGLIWVEGRAAPTVDALGNVYWHGFMHDITTRHAAEEALRDSEAKFRSYIEAAPISIVIIGADGRIEECNSMVGEVLMLPVDALLGRPFQEIIDPQDLTAVNRSFTDLVVRGQAITEFRVRKSDGALLWASARGSRLGNGRFLCYVLDITERKHAEAALLESEKRNRVALDLAELGAYSHDLATDRMTLDARAQRHFGFDRPTMTFDEFMGSLHQEDRPRIIAQIAAAHDPETGTGHCMTEKRVVHPDGSVHWIVAQTHIEFEGAGEARRARYVIGNSLDITARKAAEQALLESQQRYQTLVDTSPDAIYVARDGVILFANPAAVALLGADSAERLIGMPTLHFFAAHEHQLIIERRAQMRQGLAVPTIEHEIVRLDGGRRTVEVVVAPYPSGESCTAEMQVILRDITQRRLAEQQLAQAQRMEAIGQLTGGLAHDFNNILGIILGSLDLLSMEKVDAEARGLIGSAQSAAQRGVEVTRSLLAVVRQSPMSTRVMDVNKLVSEMRPLIQQTAGRRVHSNFEIDARRSLVSMDPGSFDTAMLNMVINARDAMPDGGRLTVRTGNRHIDGNSGIALVPVGEYLDITIEDSGVGMSAETIARAFDPFFSTKERGKGTGLGLAMVYGFARQCRGTAFIDSTPGAGTRVHVLLPVVALESEERMPEAESGQPHARDGESVLLVDDEADLRWICAEWLRAFGYAVTAVASPAEVLEAIDAQRFTALVSDVVMPGPMDGVELSAAVRQRQPGIAVLLISGYADSNMNKITPNWPLLEKPFRREQLARQLRAVIDESRQASSLN